MTVFIVTREVGVWETHTSVEGVFSTQEKAEAFIATRKSPQQYTWDDMVVDSRE